MQTLELQNRGVESRHKPLDRPGLADVPAAGVEGIMRGLVRHRANRQGAKPAMAVDELYRLRRLVNWIAGANGHILGTAPVPSRSENVVAPRPAPLRFVTLSGMDVVSANHYLRRVA